MSSDLRDSRITQRACMVTDVGMIREHNEDAALVDPQGDFFIVADGMGGHAAGEVASAMAVQAVGDALGAARDQIAAFATKPSEEGRKNLVAVLENAVRSAHQAVFERGSAEADKQGMGTTLDVLLLAGSEAFVAHVGDSRTYLIRDGKAAQITTDHTVAEVLVIEGKLSVEEALVSPLRTILVNAVGVAADVGVEMAHLKLRKGDLVLLCSDGLHDYFPTEQEIAGVVTASVPAEALEKLVTTAKNRGGHDNITGVLFEVLTMPERRDPDDAKNGGTLDTEKVLAQSAAAQMVASEDTQPVPLTAPEPVGRPRVRSSVGSAVTQPGPVVAVDTDAPTETNALPLTDGETKPLAPLPGARRARATKPGPGPAPGGGGDNSDDADEPR
jgi:serine/threonine protein phosphatase PrpC